MRQNRTAAEEVGVCVAARAGRRKPQLALEGLCVGADLSQVMILGTLSYL